MFLISDIFLLIQNLIIYSFWVIISNVEIIWFISRCIICLWWIYFNIFNACIPIKQTDFKNNFSFFEYFNKIPLSLYYNHFLLYKKLYGEFPELLSILSFLILFLKEFFYWDAFFRILKRKDHRNFTIEYQAKSDVE